MTVIAVPATLIPDCFAVITLLLRTTMFDAL
jgi:hypothetical protein